MRPELPTISINKPQKLNINDIIKKDENGEVSKINEEYKAVKRTVDARVTKSVSFTQHELNVINGFLDENKISIGDFIRLAFYRDGAFEDAFLAATNIQKRMDIDFIKIDPKSWTFNYKNNFKNFEIPLSQDLAYNSSKRKPKSLFLLDVMDRRVQKHLDERDFPSFSSFVKIALVEYGVYSNVLGAVALANLHTTKSQAKSKKVKSKDRKEAAKPLSGAIPPSAHLLYTKYNEIAKELYGGITLALVVKFIMIDKGIITDTLLEKNSPRNPLKKQLVESFLDNLENHRITLDFTEDEKKVLEDENGLKKNITISFNASNFYELKNYLRDKEVTFSELIMEWLQLGSVYS